jgi:formylglycine-generating enzyme required for sulfatase activity/predicted acylesterase/phospholipase RssA
VKVADAGVSQADPLTLIMRGGGAKGLAYVGAMLELQRFYSFNAFVGTSAGALMAALLGSGIAPRQLQHLLETTNFSTFFDAGVPKALFNLLSGKGGLFEGLALRVWLSEAIQKQLDASDPVRMKDLPHRVILYATSRNGVETFDSQGDNADVDVDVAARCSAGIPYCFTRRPHNGKNLYDGGILNNFPVQRFVQRNPGVPFIALFLGTLRQLPTNENGFVLADLLAAVLGQGERADLAEYKEQIVHVDPAPIGTLQFALEPVEKAHLMLQGRVAALDFLVRRGHYEAGDPYLTQVRESADQSRQCLLDRKRAKRRRRILWGMAGSIVAATATMVLWGPGRSESAPLVIEPRPTSNPGPESAGAQGGSISQLVTSALLPIEPTRAQSRPPLPGMIRIQGATFQVGMSAHQDFRRWCLGQGAKLSECNELLERVSLRPAQVDTFDIDRTEVPTAAFGDWLNQQLAEQSAVIVSDRVLEARTREALARPECHGVGALRVAAGRVTASPTQGLQPAICVSQVAAAAFCEAAGKRLPTDEEWELAAGGSEKRWLSWDGTGTRRPACSDAVFGRRSDGACAKLVRAPERVDAENADVTPEGVLGLSGNVSEWVAPPPGERTRLSQQVARGGSWSGVSVDLHPSKLMFLAAGYTDAANVGFRCARSVDEKGAQ